MSRNISALRIVLTLMTLNLLGLRASSSEQINHLDIRQRPAGPTNLLPDVLAKHDGLSNYTSFMRKYPDILAHAGGFAGITLLAPTDAAFAKEPDFDFNNESHVVPILQYHILQGSVLIDGIQIMRPQFFPTLLLNQTWTNITSGQRVALVRQRADEVVFISGSDSRSLLDSDRDIHFFDGVIQPINTLLVPPLQLAATVHTWFPSMTAFLGALYKTGLADEVLAARDVTLFAPDNQAFQKSFGALSELSEAELRNVLEYHIVPNQVLYSVDLQDQLQVPTRATLGDEAEPVNITITIAGNSRYIDSSQIQDPDVMIANGVVHIISDVLDPLKPEAKADPTTHTIQSPVDELEGSITTGAQVPTPYVSDLPCTSACPTLETSIRATHTRRPPTRAAAPKSTGMPGAIGLVGVLMLAAGW